MPNLLVLLTSVLGVSHVIRANLLEELQSAQASAGNPGASAGNPSAQAPAELNSADGLMKSPPDVPVASAGALPDSAGQPPATNTGGCNTNGPLLNLAPGSYIQFKVAVPPGFLARLDDTPDGGKVITVISPEPPCPKCDTSRAVDAATSTNSFDGPAQAPAPQNTGNLRTMQNVQESTQMMQRAQGSGASQQYSGQDQINTQMYMKNSAYRKVQVQQAAPLPYQTKSVPNFPPQVPQPAFQRPVTLPLQQQLQPQPQLQPQLQQQPQPQPQLQPQLQPAMNQRMVRTQYQPIASSQYLQPQYTQMNSAPDYQPQLQQQSSQYVQQGSSDTLAYQQQPLYQSQPQPQASAASQALEKFHTAVRSLDDGSNQQ